MSNFADRGSAASDRFQPARGRLQHGVATRGALWGIDGRGAASPPTTLVPRAPEGGEEACFVFQVQVWYKIAQNSSKMVRNGPKPVKIVHNMTQIVPNRSKWSQNGPNRSKIVSKWSKSIQICQNWCKIDPNHSKSVKIAKIGPNVSKIGQN